MKAIITQGISASGKTTFAENLVLEDSSWVNINRDDTRFILFCDGKKDWTKYKFTKSRENKVTEYNESCIRKCAVSGKNVIISDTNLNPKTITYLTELLTSLGYEIEFKTFDIDFEEALKRNYQREGGVSYEVLLNQYLNYQRNVKGVKVYIPDVDKSKAYIFDIDGTLAENATRSPFDLSKVKEDRPIESICEIATSLFHSGYKLIFMSGREASCSEDTRQWLVDNLGDWSTCCPLIMREAGDRRKDYIVKTEMFDRYVRNHYNILGVFDDRKQVTECCYNVLGLKTIFVGNMAERF